MAKKTDTLWWGAVILLIVGILLGLVISNVNPYITLEYPMATHHGYALRGSTVSVGGEEPSISFRCEDGSLRIHYTQGEVHAFDLYCGGDHYRVIEREPGLWALEWFFLE